MLSNDKLIAICPCTYNMYGCVLVEAVLKEFIQLTSTTSNFSGLRIEKTLLIVSYEVGVLLLGTGSWITG
jgi:hypothetical protein